ncbi:MAG: hypothetical protein QG656_1216, partial [Candidatus Hydrogenedentes bacterium]|nr:hypothetical protein [Candidatus Hydrogenedentota bacterium]
MLTWMIAVPALWALTAGSEPASVRDFSIPAKTTVPYTYCIWYKPDLEEQAFLDDVAASPPDLFHVGYQIPFKGALGPTYGHELFSDAILPPDEIPREVERIKGVMGKMRAAGVDRLIPYVYTMAFFGHHDRREGFFRFYDHWDEYRSFGLGPKPAADPILWSQERDYEQLGGGPKGIFHYHPCINNPGWSDYLDLVVRQIAEVDYDGMFFDVNTLCCFCPHCQEQFDIYLLGKYGREEMRKAFGTADDRQLDLSTIGEEFEETVLAAFKPYLAEIWRRAHLGKTLGMDGPEKVQLENDWRLLRCYMEDAQAEFPPSNGFDAYLAARFGAKRAGDVPEDQREAFIQTVLRHHFLAFLESKQLAGTLEAKFGSSDIRKRCLATPEAMMRWVETQRFWCESMTRMFARLKADGRTVYAAQGRTDDFYTVANLGL